MVDGVNGVGRVGCGAADFMFYMVGGGGCGATDFMFLGVVGFGLRRHGGRGWCVDTVLVVVLVVGLVDFASTVLVSAL